MKDFQYMINRFLTNHEKHKKYLAFVLALSMLVSFAVPLSLIQPADSLSWDVVDTELATKPGHSWSTNPTPAGSGGYFTEVQTQIPANADSFGGNNITSVTLTPGTTDGDGNITINGGSGSSIPVTFAITYTMDKDTISAEDPCIYYELPEGVTIADDYYYGATMAVIDSQYSRTIPAGYYSISADGLIVIQFTEAYIEYLKNSDTYTGTITFDGEIGRAEDADGDQTLEIGGVTVNVVFDDTVNKIQKQQPQLVENGDGSVTINWSVTVTDAGYGLAGWTVSDTMFETVGTSNITVTPSDKGSFSGNDYLITGDTEPGDTITFTYSQTLDKSAIDALYAQSYPSLSNTAVISKDDLKAQDQKSITLNRTTVSKEGVQDYESGTYNQKINWSVAIENPYGTSLKNYIVEDELLKTAEKITLTDADGNAVAYTIDKTSGKITIDGDASKVTLNYQTTAKVGYNDNTAHIQYPDAPEGYKPSASDNLTYDNPYELKKEGVYDAEYSRIKWTVTSESTSNAMTLNGITLTDAKLKNLSSIEFVSADYNHSALFEIDDGSTSVITIGNSGVTYGTATLDSTAGTVTFADAEGNNVGLRKVTFVYYTEVTDEMLNAEDKTVTNSITDSAGNSDKADVELTSPYKLTKSGSYDALNNEIVWTITVKNETSAASTINGVELTDAKLPSMVAGSLKVTTAYYNGTWLGQRSSTDGVISIGNNSAEYGTMTLDGTKITFANSGNLGLNLVTFEYRTPVTITEMINGTSFSNDVSDNKGNDNVKDTAKATNPFELHKNGTYDAELGKIIWEVYVKGPSGGSVSLDGVILTDDAFSDMTADGITVTYAKSGYDSGLQKLSTSSGSTVNIGMDSTTYGTMSISGSTITFADAEGYTLNEVKFTYMTTPDPADVAAQNKVSNIIGDNRGHTNVTGYADLTNPYTLSKSGSYDQEKQVITWTVTVENTAFATSSINGMVLTDDAFTSEEFVAGSLTVKSARYNNQYLTVLSNEGGVITLGMTGATNTEYGTMTLNGNTITFADSVVEGVDTGIQYLVFTYQTKPTSEQLATSNTVVTNEIESSKISEPATGTATITHRNSINKTLLSSTGEKLVYGNTDQDARILTWRLDVLSDGGYYGSNDQVLVDMLSTSYNMGEHYITSSQIGDAIKVYGKKNSSDSYGNPLAADYYTIKFYDALGNEITEWTETTKAKSFKIYFTEKVDTEGFRYVRVEYQTTADVTGVEVEDNASTPVQEAYTNTATFNGNTSNGGYTFTRYPGEYTKYSSLQATKSWPSNALNMLPSEIKVQLYQKVGTEEGVDWTVYSAPIALNSNNGWHYTWNDLPISVTTGTGTTNYYYKVVETTDVDGFVASYSYGTNGVTGEGMQVTITNSLEENCEKYALESNEFSDNRENGVMLKQEDLTKANIDGVDYYVIGWRLVPSSTKMVLTDVLPDGFTLCVDDVYYPRSWSPGRYESDGTKTYDRMYSYGGGNGGYEYTAGTNTLTIFGTNAAVANAREFVYYIKIPAADLEAKFDGNVVAFGVANTVTTPNGNSTTTTLTIGTDPSEDDTLLSKAGNTTYVPGSLEYTILVNPEGKTLSNSGMIDITDIFKITGYTGLTPAQVEALNASLADIDVYHTTKDENGNLVADLTNPLNPNSYTYTIENKPYEIVVEDCVTVPGNGNSTTQYYLSVKQLTAGETIDIVATYSTLGDNYLDLYLDAASLGTGTYEYEIDEANNQVHISYVVPSGKTEMEIKDYGGGVPTNIEVTHSKKEYDSTATLNISVPDETPLAIVYYYDISGTTLDAGEYITAENKASFNTGNASSNASSDKTQFVIVSSSATVTADTPPRIQKVDTNDYLVGLDAEFKLAYYDSTIGKWRYAVNATEQDNGAYSVEWASDDSTALSENDILPDGAYTFAIGDISITADSFKGLDGESGKLFKIVEVSVPSGYEGSNFVGSFNDMLTAYLAASASTTDDVEYTGGYVNYIVNFIAENPGVTEATFEDLLQMHYKGYTGGPYDNFFASFQSMFFFTYGDGEYEAPKDFSSSVMTVPSSGTLMLTNSNLMSVKATKSWDETMADTSDTKVELQLYWSTVKKTNGYPTNLTLATAADLGIVGDFTNPQTIAAGEEAYWANLPAGVDGKPVYYYVKEISYTIGSIIYKLEGDQYVGYSIDASSGKHTALTDADGKPIYGSYKPVFTGNAANGIGSEIKVYNTKGLIIKKIWRNSDNTDMDPDDIPTAPIDIVLNGVTATGTTEYIGTYTLTSEGDWQILIDDNLSKYTSFQVQEKTQNGELYYYTVSYVYNTNGPAGTIQVINKDKTPTEIAVKATKTWGDIATDLHEDDVITVTLYQAINGTLPYDAQVLVANGAKSLDTQTLSKDNNWTFTWDTETYHLPYRDANKNTYYYYVVEEKVDGYSTSYTRENISSGQSITIHNYISAPLQILKQWVSEDGTAIPGDSAVLPKYVEMAVYRALDVTQTDTSDADIPESLSIYAEGDSITYGSTAGTGGQVDEPYPTYLQGLFNSTGITVTNSGFPGYTIKQIEENLQATNGGNKVLDSSYDLITLIAGTNNLNSTQALSEMESELNSLIYSMYRLAGDDTIIFVGGVPRFTALSWSQRYSEEGVALTVVPTLTANYSASNTTEVLNSDDGIYISYDTSVTYNLSTALSVGDQLSLVVASDDQDTTPSIQFLDENGDLIGYYIYPRGEAIGTGQTFSVSNAYTANTAGVAPVGTKTVKLVTKKNYNSAAGDPLSQAYWDMLVADYNEIVQKVVDDYKKEGYNIHYVEIYSKVGNQLSDGIHPTEEGYAEIAKAFYSAITVYYGASVVEGPQTNISGTLTTEQLQSGDYEFVQNVTVTPDAEGNWSYSLEDLPLQNAKGEKYIYYIVETSSEYAENAGYANNGLTLDGESAQVTVTNEKSVTQIEINVEKVWKDGGSTNRPAITLTLERKTAADEQWTALTNAVTWTSQNGDTWKGVFTDLDMCTGSGELYYYRVVEAELEGYESTNSAENGVSANGNADARTITITNTRSGTLDLTINKEWADGPDAHLGAEIDVEIHGSTNPDDVPTDVTIIQPVLEILSGNPLTVAVEGTGKITFNKPDVEFTIADESIATAQKTGDREITITGVTIDSTTITITDGTTTHEVPITVTEKPTLTLTIENGTIAMGETTSLSAALLNGGSTEGISYQVTTGDDIVSVDANGTVTGLAKGTATITATLPGNITATVDVEVTWPAFTIDASNSTVDIAGTITLTPSPHYGEYEYAQTAGTGSVTISEPDADGKVTVTGATAGSVTITATRSDGATDDVTFTVMKGVEVTNTWGNITYTFDKLNQGDIVNFTVSAYQYHQPTLTFYDENGNSLGSYSYNANFGSEASFTTVSDYVSGTVGKIPTNTAKISIASWWANDPIPTLTITRAGGGGNTEPEEPTEEPTEPEEEETTEEETTAPSGGANVVTGTAAKGDSITLDSSKTVSQITVTVPEKKDWGGVEFYLKLNGTEVAHVGAGYGFSTWDVNKWEQDNNVTNVLPTGAVYDLSVAGTIKITFDPAVQVDQLCINKTDQYSSVSYAVTYTSAARTVTGNVSNSAGYRLSKATSDPTYIRTETLSAATNWTLSSALDAFDENGNPYYYWIVEENVTGYTPSYQYNDADEVTNDVDYCINAAAPGEARITVRNTPSESGGTSMPSTGGKGTTWIYITGMAMMLCGIAGFTGLKRRQSSQR